MPGGIELGCDQMQGHRTPWAHQVELSGSAQVGTDDPLFSEPVFSSVLLPPPDFTSFLFRLDCTRR